MLSNEAGSEVKSKKPVVLKYGLNHVTTLVENKTAKLVVHLPLLEQPRVMIL